MQKILVVMLVSILATAIVAQAAAKKEAPKGPTPAQIEKAADKAVYDKEHTATHKLPENQGEVRFIPAKIGDFNDGERAKGVIIGKLDTPHKTVDGNAPGMYQVFMCKEGGKWAIYYCQKGEVVAGAKSVDTSEHNFHEPAFIEKGHAIHYWYLQFSW